MTKENDFRVPEMFSNIFFDLNLSEVKNILFSGEAKFRKDSTFDSGYFVFETTRRQQRTNATNITALR